jgi:hypothetical protein
MFMPQAKAISPVLDLSTFGGTNAGAGEVNGVGQIVGTVRDGNEWAQAFMWSFTDGVRTVGTLGGDFSFPTAALTLLANA